jgi:hypothetical protein
MRIQNEQSGSSSLFAQPVVMEPMPEEQGLGTRDVGTREQGTEKQGIGNREQGIENNQNPSAEQNVSGHDFSRADKRSINEGALAPEAPVAAKPARGVLEGRLEDALAALAQATGPPSATVRQAHLALLKRWYYRPEARRAGEIFFPDANGRWPIKAMLRGVGRVAASKLKSSTSSPPSLPQEAASADTLSPQGVVRDTHG